MFFSLYQIMTKEISCFRRGVFPYSYFDSMERLYEKKLPCKEAFRSDLTGEGITDKEYSFALACLESFWLSNFSRLYGSLFVG